MRKHNTPSFLCLAEYCRIGHTETSILSDRENIASLVAQEYDNIAMDILVHQQRIFEGLHVPAFISNRNSFLTA